MVGFRGTAIGPDDPITRSLEAGLGGVILFDQDRDTGIRNIESPAQLAALTGSLRAVASSPTTSGATHRPPRSDC